MKRKGKRGNVWVSNSIIFLFIIFVSFFPGKVAAEDFIQQVEKLKESIKQGQGPSGEVFAYILGYAAIREENLSVCGQSESDFPHIEGDFDIEGAFHKCKQPLEDLWHIRMFAENKCDGIFLVEDEPSDKRLFAWKKTLCEHLGDCDNAPEEVANMCYGFKNGDLSAWTREKDPVDVPPGVELGIYKGFEHGRDQKFCEKYVFRLEEGRFAYLCEVIFSDDALNDILDKVAEDLAYFELAQKYRAQSFCRKIKNVTVKEACLSFPDITGYFFEGSKEPVMSPENWQSEVSMSLVGN
ncbi:MAG: hypothetical protein AB1650_05635 [Candidatus Omnitrophota bacterium]